MPTLLKRLEEVLNRCRDHSIRLSLQKMEVGTSVKFAGHIISGNGIMPDPDKVEAIRAFKTPENVTDLRSFLGLANQLGHFLPDLAQATSHIRKLLRKEAAFLWLPEHEAEFQAAKKLLTGNMLVQQFDPSLKTELLTDASRLHGLGYCLIQRKKDGSISLISCGSCSLSDTQSRYATIELECLAIQWAVYKCSFWLKGMTSFQVVTDHRPLLGVFNKPLFEIENPRLQRIRAKLSGYNFTLSWTAGKDHCIADALSRAPVWPANDPHAAEDVLTVKATMDLSTELKLFIDSIDNNYRSIVEAISSGKDIKNLPPDHPAHPFKNVWDQLSLENIDDAVLIALDGRLVVPDAARPEVLRLLHVPHQGLVKTKQQARSLYYWPGMNDAVTATVEGCQICASHLPSQPSDPLLEPSHPETAMTHVGADLCEANGRHYLVVVDRFSGFLFVKHIKNQSTSTVCSKLSAIFRDFGWPAYIRTDSGPCFRSEFADFCAERRIIHELASAYNPSSNGLAEARVKNAKKLLLKCAATDEDFEEALSEFRLTPRADGFSPAELFYGRRPRGVLPALPRGPTDVAKGIDKRRQSLQAAADRSDKKHENPSFNIGDQVLLQDRKSGRWNSGFAILDVRQGGRSYAIKNLVDSTVYLRNRKFIKSASIHSLAASVPQTTTQQSVPLRRSTRQVKAPVRFNL
jgi:transposase InsO family protein